MSDDLALRLEGLGFAYREQAVFRSLDLAVPKGDMVAVLGPNGTGKTTLMRLASGAVRPSAGRVVLFDRDLAELAPRERARLVAVVPQESPLLYDFAVEEVVLMGRSPYTGILGLERARDREVARSAMARTGISHLAARSFRALSGGERQRVVIARALAQETRLLLLDEPTAFLDLRHQLAVYDLLRTLNHDSGLTLVLASHDVNLAARHCARLVLLRHGEVFADGTPEDVLRPEHLEAVYGVRADVRTDAATGRPFVVPIGTVPSPPPPDRPAESAGGCTTRK